MEQQKTPMQKLIDYMRANFHLTESTEFKFEDSLLAEKNQIEAAFDAGQNDCSYLYNSSGEDYYKSNFNNSGLP